MIGTAASAMRMAAATMLRSVKLTMLDREEALRAQRQYRSHQEIDQHGSDRRSGRLRDRALEEFAQQAGQEHAPDRIDDADEQRTVECAADRADAARHD